MKFPKTEPDWPVREPVFVASAALRVPETVIWSLFIRAALVFRFPPEEKVPSFVRLFAVVEPVTCMVFELNISPAAVTS